MFDFFDKWVMPFVMGTLGLLFFLVLGLGIYQTWQKSTSEVDYVYELHEIVDKDTETYTQTTMAGKTPVITTREEYYLITAEGRRIKTSKSIYNKYNAGDVIVLEHTTYIKNSVIIDEEYSVAEIY